MSLNPEIDLEFGDGEYTFALRMPQLIELEEKCGYRDAQNNWRKRGAVAVYGDLLSGVRFDGDQMVVELVNGVASVGDCREIIRLGLIGGAGGRVGSAPVTMTPVLARQLCDRYVDTRPAAEWLPIAFLALHGAMKGFEPKKAGPAVAGGSTRKRRSTRARSSSTAG